MVVHKINADSVQQQQNSPTNRSIVSTTSSSSSTNVSLMTNDDLLLSTNNKSPNKTIQQHHPQSQLGDDNAYTRPLSGFSLLDDDDYDDNKNKIKLSQDLITILTPESPPTPQQQQQQLITPLLVESPNLQNESMLNELRDNLTDTSNFNRNSCDDNNNTSRVDDVSYDRDDGDDEQMQIYEKRLSKFNNPDFDDDDSSSMEDQNGTLWGSVWNWLSPSSNEIGDIEIKLFRMLNSKTTMIERDYVHIRNKSMKIWTLIASLNKAVEDDPHVNTPIVLVHGFCGGVGLWLQNIEQLSKSRTLYAFDLLGFGRSSRPPFSADSIVAEMQFVESIEDWRKQLGIKEMILLGQGFGAYLVSSYAIKYPQHTKALLLIDPWGFTENTSNAAAAPPPPPTTNGTYKLDTPTPLWIRLLTNVSRYVSPLSLFRATGPIGVSLFKYLRPDFKNKYRSILGNTNLIYDYLYHCNKQYPSGEDGFRSISEYYGFAKNPMIKRIEKINANIPIWFIYGSRSWIDSTPGFSAKYIRNRFAYVSVKIIPGAGHHVYADKPELFNLYVNEVLDLIDAQEKENNQNYPGSSCSSGGASFHCTS